MMFRMIAGLLVLRGLWRSIVAGACFLVVFILIIFATIMSAITGN